MKAKWLKNIKTEWLIMGHLTENEALSIVNDSEASLTYKQLQPY